MEDDFNDNIDPAAVDYNDPNQDDFGDLWDDKESEEDDGKDKTTAASGDDDGTANDNEDGKDDPESDTKGDDGASEDGDGDEEDDTSENEFELSLVDGFDEGLVNRVETLLEGEQLYLPIEKVQELFDGTDASYTKLMEANKVAMHNTTVANIYKGLPERGKEFFNYLIKTGGTGDLDGWMALEKQQATLNDIDVNALTEEQAKAILKEDHKTKGLSDKQSKYILEAHEDNADLIPEAKAMYAEKQAALAEAKTAKLAADQADAIAEKNRQTVRQQNILKAINGTKYTTAKQQEIFNYIYTSNEGSSTPKIVDAISSIIQNKPEHLVQLVTLFDGYDVEKGFDLTRLKKQVASETTRQTKTTIKRRTMPSTKGRQTTGNTNSRDASLDDWLSDVEL